MAEMFATLLRHAVADPEMKVSTLELHTDEQKQKLKKEKLERKQSSMKKLMRAELKVVGLESGTGE